CRLLTQLETKFWQEFALVSKMKKCMKKVWICHRNQPESCNNNLNQIKHSEINFIVVNGIKIF
ncbi:MAG: hypothetical protein ACK476_05560, partial [Fluviicola sp.]